MYLLGVESWRLFSGLGLGLVSYMRRPCVCMYCTRLSVDLLTRFFLHGPRTRTRSPRVYFQTLLSLFVHSYADGIVNVEVLGWVDVYIGGKRENLAC